MKKNIITIIGVIILAIVTLVGTYGFFRALDWCIDSARKDKIEQKPQAKEITLEQDFFMGSKTAVARAKQGGLPPNWSIVCDGQGHYAPAYFGTVIAQQAEEIAGGSIRTNEFEASVVAWRFVEIVEEKEKEESKTPRKTYNWSECK